MLPVRRCDVYHPHAGIAAEAVAERAPRNTPGGRAAAVAGWPTASTASAAGSPPSSGNCSPGPNPPVVLCLSEYIKRDVRRHYPQLPDSRLVTLFNAVDLEKFDPAARAEAARGSASASGFPRTGRRADDRAGLRRKGLARGDRARGAGGRRTGSSCSSSAKGTPAPYQRLAGAARRRADASSSPGRRPTLTPSTARRTSSSCRPATTRAASSCSKRWRWACR